MLAFESILGVIAPVLEVMRVVISALVTPKTDILTSLSAFVRIFTAITF